MIIELGHKATRYSEVMDIFTAEEKGGLLLSNFNGVNIFTDNVELHGQLSMIDTGGYLPAFTELIYLTETPISIGAFALKSMTKINGGEIHTNYPLTQFAFCGPNKLGTLLSMVYGIRALYMVEKAILGVHSATIYDNARDCVHVLLGANRVGKSSIGLQLEGTKKFELLADDWNEVDMNNDTVKPISNVFSVEEMAGNPKYTDAFTSFGKRFFFKNDPIIPYGKLGKVIVLQSSQAEDFLVYDFFKKVQSHIPFVVDGLNHNGEIKELVMGNSTEHFRQLVDHRLMTIYNFFLRLVQRENNIVFINDRAMSLQEASCELYKLIDQ